MAKKYMQRLEEAVKLYKQGVYQREMLPIKEMHGSKEYYPVVCYACLKRIKEEHVKIIMLEGRIEIELRFHKNCLDERLE